MQPLWLAADEVRSARSTLGVGHPLARALSFQRTLARQLVASLSALLLGIAALLAGLERAPIVLGAACLVTIGVAMAFLGARRLVRERSEELLAVGEAPVLLPVVAREWRRLASTREREHLARSLETLLRDAERWSRTPPAFRPLPGVECLRFMPREVHDIARLLRGEPARVRGVALTSRLLYDGIGSPLYGGEVEKLREELHRISYLLEQPAGYERAAPAERRAA